MSVTSSSAGIAKPASIRELRELVVAISRNDAEITMGTKTLSVLGRLVEHPEQAAVSTITELAASLDVNASTLSRLARSLGFSGFAEFQRVFRDAVASQAGRFYSGQASRLIPSGSAEARDGGPLDAAGRLFQESIVNIESCLAQLDASELDVVTGRLARARRIRVHGIRQIHAVATVLVYGLGLIRPDVGLLEVPGQGPAENLANMTADDVLIVASVSPYSRIVADVAATARQNGISVIALTDYRSSPLAANADHVFFVPHQSSFISNSLGAYIVLCEALINLVARKLGDRALQSLKRQEQFIDYLRIETG